MAKEKEVATVTEEEAREFAQIRMEMTACKTLMEMLIARLAKAEQQKADWFNKVTSGRGLPTDGAYRIDPKTRILYDQGNMSDLGIVLPFGIGGIGRGKEDE
jgi:hypothetical protein